MSAMRPDALAVKRSANKVDYSEYSEWSRSYENNTLANISHTSNLQLKTTQKIQQIDNSFWKFLPHSSRGQFIFTCKRSDEVNAFICSANSAILGYIKAKRERIFGCLICEKEEIYESNGEWGTHARARMWMGRARERERGTEEANAERNSCRSFRECRPSLVILRSVARIVLVIYVYGYEFVHVDVPSPFGDS